MKINFEDILSAAKAIDPVANNTPLIESSFLSKMSPNKFYLKLESVQPIGAFKIRGAVNAIKNLPSRTRGVTCASTGNHGRGGAFAAQKENLLSVARAAFVDRWRQRQRCWERSDWCTAVSCTQRA